jgi:Protein of unknown function (DUF3445)
LFIQEPKDFFPGNVNNLWSRDIIIRHERQTFHRLPKTNAVVFTVKTSITPLVQFPKEELEGLAAEIRSWPEGIATYKGRSLWGRPVLGYCDGTQWAVEDVELMLEYGSVVPWRILGGVALRRDMP